MVTLTAQPDPEYKLLSWTGTDNDNLNTLRNTVKMTDHKTVYVEFVAEAVCGDDEHPNPDGDLSGDCVTDFLDVAILAENWLTDNQP